MVGTLFGLFLLHRKNRDQEREKRAAYWREQVRLIILHVFLKSERTIVRTHSIKTFYKCETLRELPFFLCQAMLEVSAAPCTVAMAQTNRMLPF